MVETWDEEADVVIVGSGAAALSAAVSAAEGGCSVLILEKANLLGGTTAWSGGMPWVPLNHHMAEAGIPDSREEVLGYLEGLAADRVPDQELVEVFVDRAAEAIAFLEEHTPLSMTVVHSYSDYYCDRPGSKLKGRSLEPVPVRSPELLGEWHALVRDTPHIPRMTQDEMAAAGSRRNLPLDENGQVPTSVADLVQRRERDGVRTIGAALVSSLLKGALDLGVRLMRQTPVERLVTEPTVEGRSRVVGVVATQAGRTIRVRARRGVVLGTGGFEWNKEFVLAFLGVPDTFPLSPPHNQGDGLVMGMEQGALLGNMTAGVPFPCAYDERSTAEGAPLGLMGAPRNDPGCVVVNRSGRRFANEGMSYNDLAKVHRTFDPTTAGYPNQGPVWMIFDESTRERTIVGDFAPGSPTPDWVVEAPTVRELAVAIGVDPVVLDQELQRYNGHAANGSDPEFHRGELWWEGFQVGGPSPAANLAPCERAPFYAMKLYNGLLGTVGGLRIDRHARVLAARGGVVDGLYAAGNVAAGIFGQTYPGGGATIGPALTFGYLAGRHLSEDVRSDLDRAVTTS